jgi:hypothetical protein
MFHMMYPFGFGLAGFGLLAGLAGIAYPVLVIWMIIDGVLRADAEYPGTDPNRKVLWVVFMVLFHPVSIAYFIAVFLKVKRGSLAPAYGPPPIA